MARYIEVISKASFKLLILLRFFKINYILGWLRLAEKGEIGEREDFIYPRLNTFS